ncbi:MAG TPA: peptidoglycan-binding protein [Bacillota bacterium]
MNNFISLVIAIIFMPHLVGATPSLEQSNPVVKETHVVEVEGAVPTIDAAGLSEDDDTAKARIDAEVNKHESTSDDSSHEQGDERVHEMGDSKQTVDKQPLETDRHQAADESSTTDVDDEKVTEASPETDLEDDESLDLADEEAERFEESHQQSDTFVDRDEQQHEQSVETDREVDIVEPEPSSEDREQREEVEANVTAESSQRETSSDDNGEASEPQPLTKDFNEEHDLEANKKAEKKRRATTFMLSTTSTSPPLKKGTRHEDLIDLKKMLNYSGYGGIKVTNYFGSYTEKRVKQFQKNNGLKITGEIDRRTKNKINKNFASIYQKGGKHPNIKKLKRRLNRLGFSGIKVTDYFGSFTEKRVRDFQKYYRLSVTGKANLDTLDHLQITVSSPFQRGKRHSKTPTLKKQLNKLGFGNIKVTTLYGSFMEKRMKDFQRYYGLKTHGIADSRTLDKLDEVINSPFQREKRHSQTKTLKKQLNKLGFGNIKVTTLYGSFMEKRMKDFQRYYGLKAHGIADSRTWAKIDEILSIPYQRGQRHQNTIKLKKKLNNLGFSGIKETDYYGSFTEKRVKQFQKSHNLPVSGIADEKTIATMQSLKPLATNNVKIFLDPGHGGHDPGAQAYGLQEKDVVLDIALQTARFLTRNYSGIDIKLSRTTDEFVELKERARMANSWGADYFVSIHNNSFTGSAHGFESYIHSDEHASSDALIKQNEIHTYIVNEIGIRDRGMKKANFSVLRNTQMPAILLEYLFIDHFDENNKLKKASYRSFLGEITAKAIANAFHLPKI